MTLSASTVVNRTGGALVTAQRHRAAVATSKRLRRYAMTVIAQAFRPVAEDPHFSGPLVVGA